MKLVLCDAKRNPTTCSCNRVQHFFPFRVVVHKKGMTLERPCLHSWNQWTPLIYNACMLSVMFAVRSPPVCCLHRSVFSPRIFTVQLFLVDTGPSLAY